MNTYDVIKTGSKGNCVVFDGNIAVDMGIPYKAILPYVKSLKLVLLTHIHGDHFNRSTVAKLANERPSLRFGCCEWMVKPLAENNVSKKNIDVYEPNKMFLYNLQFGVTAFETKHNVPNCGYKLYWRTGGNGINVFYATDTSSLDGVSAVDYEFYFIEANYGEDEIAERIRDKQFNGGYIYEYQAAENHLSREKAEAWIGNNAGNKSKVIYLHMHD
jgi:hypothetical protein